MKDEIVIKISTPGGGKPFLRQLPHGVPVWGNCRFYINEEVESCDLWVVYGGLDKIESTHFPSNGTLFITNEPPSVKRFSKGFTKQFSAIMTCPGTVQSHPNTIYNQQALPWWVGHKIQGDKAETYDKTYDELKSITSVEKTKLLSVISSNKRFTRGHRLRDDFVKLLKKELGDMVDVFGIGSTPIEDKWDAIAPYKYHIVIENNTCKDCWTEKIADSFLGLSYPLYYGCPNITEYFPQESITAIDITKPKEAVEKIREVLAKDTYAGALPSLKKSKELVLDTYQLFPLLVAHTQKHPPRGENVFTTLAPEPKSGIVQRVYLQAMRLYEYLYDYVTRTMLHIHRNR